MAGGAAGRHRWGGRRGWRRGTGGSGCKLNGERREEGGAARPICALGPCLPSAGPMGHLATFFFFLFFRCKPFVLTAFKKTFFKPLPSAPPSGTRQRYSLFHVLSYFV